MSTRKPAPSSRLGRRAGDGRSREARYIKAVKRQLSEQVGGNPTAIQAALIDRIAWLRLRLQLAEERMLADPDGPVEPQYLPMHGALTRALRQLGLKAGEAPVPSLADYIAQKGRTT